MASVNDTFHLVPAAIASLRNGEGELLKALTSALMRGSAAAHGGPANEQGSSRSCGTRPPALPSEAAGEGLFPEGGQGAAERLA